MTFKAAKNSPLFINMSEGNKKLIPTAEQAYPNCLPARLAKLAATRENGFVERMIFTIEAYASRPAYMKAKTIVVRLHESGDFYNPAYMLKWFQIAEHFKNDKRFVFMAYTKSVKFIDMLHEAGHDIPKNMVIRFSIWDDTKPEDIETARRHGLTIYTAVDKFTKGIPSQHRCRCKDCATCGKCWSKTKQLICEIH